MISRKEEERNEKIIRGLMKLPPNRRCINCNSLGPQYVCTNFWTFVCITCSGIHREFTHRVKSVSMAKFTSQEVDALQRGGNQRARETLLKDWDIQRQRLPDSSNVDRVREFIKHVYVDRRYAGGKIADKPPRDTQSLKNNEDETRRASSYHSFSQSPPYEYQYEDRRYGKHGGMLSRKPGSDRGNYEGKISSFVYSPGRLGEQMYEDRFANEGSGSRVSDYYVSSSGDPFRSGTQSPNFQDKVSSPPAYPVRDILVEDTRRQTVSASAEGSAKRDSAGIAHTQRNASLGSVRSLDSNSVSPSSVTSGSLLDIVSDSNQSTGTRPDGTAPVPFLSESPVSANGVVSDPFSFQIVQQPATSSIQSVDLFKTPEIPSCPSIDLFSDFTHQPLTVASSEQNPSKVSLPENGRWATFDIPQHEASIPQVKTAPPPTMPSGGVKVSANSSMQSPSVSYQSNEASISQMMNVPLASMPHGDVHSSANSSMQWPSVSYTSHSLFLSVDNQWHENSHEFQAPSGSTGESWNAFEDASANIPQPSYQNFPYTSNPQVVEYNHPSNAFNKPPSTGDLSSKVPEGGMSFHANDWKSTNPFDSVLEPDTGFSNMNSLQAALPDSQLPPAYVGGLTQSWFPPNTTTPYIQTTPQGGLPFMVGEATAPQLLNIPSQSPVTSLGGNPFA